MSAPPNPAQADSKASIWWRAMGFAAALAVLVVLPGLISPTILKSHKDVPLVQALSNSRQVYTLLMQFEEDWGAFLSEQTAVRLQNAVGEARAFPLSGTSSNALLRQLIAGGYIRSEEIFHVPTAGGHPPDNRVGGLNALAPGECGFAYVTGCSSARSPGRPMLLTPLIPGTRRFDPVHFKHKAVVVFLDGSSMALNINPAGHALHDGQDILDPAHPCWAGEPPVLAMPV